jgi:hypothetical protein
MRLSIIWSLQRRKRRRRRRSVDSNFKANAVNCEEEEATLLPLSLRQL